MKSQEQLKHSSHSLLNKTNPADLPLIQGNTAGAASQLQLGQILANRYCIKEPIGAGASGAVYIAFDQTRNKDIALKVLLPELTSSERFLDGVRLAKNFSHPCIVNVFDVQSYGRGDQAQWFITMELLEGQNLRSFLDNHEANFTPVDIDETIEIIAKLCDALEYAHGKTVHRDIKPENIFLIESGEIKLMDFGIAHLMSNSPRAQTGVAMGTACYKAPEQMKGCVDIDGRADQYALGILMYEMLSGEVPTRRIELLNKVRKDVPAGLSKVIDKALSPKVDDRFADIVEFGLALAKKDVGLLGFSITKSVKGLGIVAGVVVAVLLVGGLTRPGSLADVWTSIKPVFKEEIAHQKGSVIKSLGEITNDQQWLRNGQRQLFSYLCEAQRIDSPDVDALVHRPSLTDNAIFAGSQITELEGEYDGRNSAA